MSKRNATTATDEPKRDVYQMITDAIVAALEAGTVPWRQPWVAGAASLTDHRNAVSGKAYRGVNPFILAMTASAAGYTDPRWLTFKQARDLGGCVRKGEHGAQVVFWKIDTRRETDEESEAAGRPGEPRQRKTFLLRYYTLFSVEQCDGLKLKPLAPVTELPEVERIAAAEAIIANMQNRPEMRFDQAGRAFYSPILDRVQMPPIEGHVSPSGYYATAFHELSHSTGHTSRLGRRDLEAAAAFGDEVYSREELVAEFSAAFLCGTAGIDNAQIENSAAYIASWLRALKDDRKLIVVAAAQGQKAAEFILGASAAESDETAE